MFYSAFDLANDWYGPRKHYDESLDDFNSNFFNPFVKLVKWYLEESVSYNSNDYFSKKEVKLFEEKLDEIKNFLFTLQDGQEVLFEEIEDLREQLLRSKKKNWMEMFKGKFYDFVFEKTISIETFDVMYKILAGDKSTEISGFIHSLTP